MGSLYLTSVLLLVLACRNNAARLYPTDQEVKVGNNETIFFHRFARQILPHPDSESGGTINYLAGHRSLPGASDVYYGFSVTMDVYGHSLSPEQITLTSAWIFDEGDFAVESLNAIQIGWEVVPFRYGDSRTHLAASWTTDGFKSTGCANANCTVGFQPEKGAPMALGDVIEQVSQPNGDKQTITIKVVKDSASGDWLVHYGHNQDNLALIGRYPKSLFTGGLANRGTAIRFGSYVVSRSDNLAPMGSGYLPADNTAPASFNNIQYIDQNGQASPVADGMSTYMTHPNTYSVTDLADGQFFYGGPKGQSTT